MNRLHKNITNLLNWMFDNLLFPFLRESAVIMQITRLIRSSELLGNDIFDLEDIAP